MDIWTSKHNIKSIGLPVNSENVSTISNQSVNVGIMNS